MDADALVDRVQQAILSYGAATAVIAVSGGVDSGVVAAVATEALGPGAVLAVTAVSPSYPSGELESARDVATFLGIEHQVISTREVEREAYARNDGERCFHCKTELYATIHRLAAGLPRDVVLLAGANADDAADFRPGLRAGRRQGIHNPLLEERLGKDAVRAVARALGLPVAEKPALACLSSRVAFGIRITPELLTRIDRAERTLRALGFAQVRVRHLGRSASIEVPVGEVDDLLGHPALEDVTAELRAMGWADVEVDPVGYRSGSMNATLVPVGRKTPS
jgi:pyridinium-3,5-biscarboxylic acid mononucleotide sulfurtransferase